MNKSLLVGAGVLLGMGCLLGAAGLVLGGTAVASATRQWVRQLDRPPTKAAKMKWEQARAAGVAGARAWQGRLEA